MLRACISWIKPRTLPSALCRGQSLSRSHTTLTRHQWQSAWSACSIQTRWWPLSTQTQVSRVWISVHGVCYWETETVPVFLSCFVTDFVSIKCDARTAWPIVVETFWFWYSFLLFVTLLRGVPLWWDSQTSKVAVLCDIYLRSLFGWSNNE
jgi:hypothetical protein